MFKQKNWLTRVKKRPLMRKQPDDQSLTQSVDLSRIKILDTTVNRQHYPWDKQGCFIFKVSFEIKILIKV